MKSPLRWQKAFSAHLSSLLTANHFGGMTAWTRWMPGWRPAGSKKNYRITLICIDLSNVADLVDVFLFILLKQYAERRAGGVTTIDQSDMRGLDTAEDRVKSSYIASFILLCTASCPVLSANISRCSVLHHWAW